jgi:tRNA pseudouridine55 synthase
MAGGWSAGFVVCDKPPGWTSRDAVDVVQRLVKPAKVGHGGTLDPLATGVLVIAIGAATRLISRVQAGRKIYRGRFRLGQTSDTDDVTGTILQESPWEHITEAALRETLARFVGRIDQVPPQFSAVHVQGKRAYELARAGTVAEIAAKPVEIDSIELEEFAPPEFALRVVCGSGTYLRSLGRDVGAQLGCGALMTALRREQVGPFTLTGALNPDGLTRDDLQRGWLPATTALADLASVTINAETERRCRQGQSWSIPAAIAAPGEVVLQNERGELVAIATIDSRQDCRPTLVFPAEPTTSH